MSAPCSGRPFRLLRHEPRFPAGGQALILFGYRHALTGKLCCSVIRPHQETTTPRGKMPQRHDPSDMRLNLGCGPIQPEGWINVDGSNRAWLATRFPRLDRILTKLRL